MLQVDIERVIRSWGARDKVPNQLVEAVIRQIKPSLRLIPRPNDARRHALGGSRIGGFPDLPVGRDWPHFYEHRKKRWGRDLALPLQFLAQINLAEISAFEFTNQLPSNGILYFFYEGPNHVTDECSVIFDDSMHLQRAVPPAEL
jgi:uncharacterized protein YwqG